VSIGLTDIEMNKRDNDINESVYEMKIVYRSNDNILEHFESNAIREELSNLKNVLYIRFEISERFNGLRLTKINQLSHKCINKSVLLHFESQIAHGSIIYWKSKGNQYFLNYKFSEENSEEFKDFVTSFIKDSLKKGHQGMNNSFYFFRFYQLQVIISNIFIIRIGLHHYYSKLNKMGEVQLNCFADLRDYNFLLLAAEAGNTRLVKNFLDLNISSISSDNKINAQELAWNGQHFDTLLVLLKSNLTYPKSFDIGKCSEEVRKFYKISLEFHKAIYSKNEDKILEIITNNPTLCHFYNYSNESAPKIALNCKYVDVYKLLLTQKIFLGRHETFNETWENFTNFERKILREIHFKHSMYLPEKYLHDLSTNSRVAHDDPNVKAKRNLIEYAFDVLNTNPFTKIILMIVAASKNFQILFDFCRDSVHLLDPTANFNMKGLFYYSGRIYISAWLLMFQSTENQTFGTLAHELCHFAMKLVYKNMAKPYYRNDRDSKDKFEEISKICKINRGKEPIIDLSSFSCFVLRST